MRILHYWCSQVASEAQPCTLPPTPPSPPPFSPAPQPPGSTPSRLSVAVSTPVGSAVTCDGLIAALWQVCFCLPVLFCGSCQVFLGTCPRLSSFYPTPSRVTPRQFTSPSRLPAPTDNLLLPSDERVFGHGAVGLVDRCHMHP